MPLPTNLLLNVVGAKLNELDSLKSQLHDALDVDADLSLRLEILVGGERYTLTVNGDEIMVKDELRDKVIASGDREIAEFALKGLEATPSEPS